VYIATQPDEHENGNLNECFLHFKLQKLIHYTWLLILWYFNEPVLHLAWRLQLSDHETSACFENGQFIG